MHYPYLPQHGGVRGTLHEAGHYGERPIQVPGLHAASQEQVRGRLHPQHQAEEDGGSTVRDWFGGGVNSGALPWSETQGKASGVVELPYHK